MNFAKFLRSAFFTEHPRLLLLEIVCNIDKQAQARQNIYLHSFNVKHE